MTKLPEGLIKQAVDVQPLSEVRALFVGRKGTGKSTAAIQIARAMGHKAFIYDIDHRIQSLRGIPDVDYFQPKQGAGFAEVDDVMSYHLDLIKRNAYPYGTTLFSSMTSIEALLLRDAVNLMGERRRDKGKGEGGYTLGRLEMTDMPHYKYVSIAIDQLFLNGLFYFPGNVIIEAHIVDDYDSQGNVSGQRILSTPKMAEKIPTYFDEVWEFSKNDPIGAQPPQYRVRFRSNLADTTYKQLPNGQHDITGKNFYDCLKGWLNVA